MPDKRERQQGAAGRRKVTQVKIRVTALKAMRRSMLLQKLRESIESGVIDGDIEVQSLDWGKVKGSRFKPHTRLTPPDVEELTKVYNVLAGADAIRFERT